MATSLKSTISTTTSTLPIPWGTAHREELREKDGACCCFGFTSGKVCRLERPLRQLVRHTYRLGKEVSSLLSHARRSMSILTLTEPTYYCCHAQCQHVGDVQRSLSPLPSITFTSHVLLRVFLKNHFHRARRTIRSVACLSAIVMHGPAQQSYAAEASGRHPRLALTTVQYSCPVWRLAFSTLASQTLNQPTFKMRPCSILP